MRIEINSMQSQPSMAVIGDNGVILAQVYPCKDRSIVSTKNGNFEIPVGCRTSDGQVGDIQQPPERDGFVVYED